jgi:hypothetical protein
MGVMLARYSLVGVPQCFGNYSQWYSSHRQGGTVGVPQDMKACRIDPSVHASFFHRADLVGCPQGPAMLVHEHQVQERLSRAEPPEE